jgi:hypothetical protein
MRTAPFDRAPPTDLLVSHQGVLPLHNSPGCEALSATVKTDYNTPGGGGGGSGGSDGGPFQPTPPACTSPQFEFTNSGASVGRLYKCSKEEAAQQ